MAGGLADAGLGIESAARARGLHFVPLVCEDYYLVCLREALEQPATRRWHYRGTAAIYAWRAARLPVSHARSS